MENQNYIKILQNYLQKKNPVYNLVFDEDNGPSHLFKYTVTAKNKTVIGEGKSKQQAKQDAARLLYEIMIKKEIEEVAPEKNQKGNNLVEDLFNICKNLYLRPPIFKCEISKSHGHSPSYIVSCEVSGLKVEMQAFRKRKAEEKAASRMILKLKEVENIIEKHFINMTEHKKFDEEKGLSTNTLIGNKNKMIQELLDGIEDVKMSNFIKPSKLLNEIKHKDISELNDPERVFRQILKEMEYEPKTDCYYVPGYGWIYTLQVYGIRCNFIHGDKVKSAAKKKTFVEALTELCKI